MVTDPISDFLVRLKNASMVRKEVVIVPFSAMKLAIAQVLNKEGYISGAQKQENTLSVQLSYANGRPAISGVKRISKPSRRLYMGVRDIKPVKRGYGLIVLSTPNGIVSGKEAKVNRVGGEVLFEIW